MNATLQIHTPSYGGPFGAQYNLLAECISCRQWMVIQAFAMLYHHRETSGLQQHVRAEFSEYVQTHEEHDSDMHEWTVSVIRLGPNGNQQGGHYFMSLVMGAKSLDSVALATRDPKPSREFQ